jgi:hypothetical protein
MKATRRTVLGWLLALCIAPPRLLPVVTDEKEAVYLLMERWMEEVFSLPSEGGKTFIMHPTTFENLKRLFGNTGIAYEVDDNNTMRLKTP